MPAASPRPVFVLPSYTAGFDLIRLEVYLSKNTEGPWPQVVEGDSGGQMVANEEEAATIHERLAHLTAENWVCLTLLNYQLVQV